MSSKNNTNRGFEYTPHPLAVPADEQILPTRIRGPRDRSENDSSTHYGWGPGHQRSFEPRLPISYSEPTPDSFDWEAYFPDLQSPAQTTPIGTQDSVVASGTSSTIGLGLGLPEMRWPSEIVSGGTPIVPMVGTSSTSSAVTATTFLQSVYAYYDPKLADFISSLSPRTWHLLNMPASSDEIIRSLMSPPSSPSYPLGPEAHNWPGQNYTTPGFQH